METTSRDFQAAEDLETSLSFLRAALDSTADGILVVDRKGKIVLYNSKFTQMWRVPAEALRTRDDERVLSAVIDQLLDPKAFLAKVRDLYARPEEISLDLLRLTDDRTFERYSQPQRMGGVSVGRVWSFRDISDRARSEERLAQRTAELQAVLDNMLDVVFACDARGRLFLVNEAARKLGAPAQTLEELHERLWPCDLQGRRFGPDELPLARALKGEQVRNFDVMIAPATGRPRSMRVTAAPIRDKAGKVLAAVSVSRDVTESIELDHLKDQFVRVAAHELKTPVAVMKSYAQLALRQAEELPAEVIKTLRGIDRGADRIDRIVRNLLDISQLLLGPLPIGLERLDLGELIELVARREEPLAGGRLKVATHRGVIVWGNRERLIQVFEALLDNAIRYSQAGGEVQVSLRTLEDDAVVEIEDHGVGIAEDKQARIFERFYRAHSGTAYDYGGMGVGLFLSREIVRQHGGRMWFQSVDGVGSRFFISLPRAGGPS